MEKFFSRKVFNFTESNTSFAGAGESGVVLETQHQNVTILHGNTVDYEQLISASENEFDLSQACCRLTATNNYKYYAVMRLPTDDEDTLASICMVTNWPINLIEEYDRLELLKDSPLFGHMKTSTEPLIFELPENTGAIIHQ